MKRKRLRWARKYSLWTKKMWSRVWFLDEANFETSATSKGGRVRRQKGVDNRYEERFTQPNYRKPEKVMMLGGISGTGKCFHFFLQKGERMTSKTYTSILKEEVCDLKNFTVLQDNASIHTSRESIKFLKDENITTVFLLPNSPDINPIENMFGLTKQLLQSEDTRSVSNMKK